MERRTHTHTQNIAESRSSFVCISKFSLHIQFHISLRLKFKRLLLSSSLVIVVGGIEHYIMLRMWDVDSSRNMAFSNFHLNFSSLIFSWWGFRLFTIFSSTTLFCFVFCPLSRSLTKALFCAFHKNSYPSQYAAQWSSGHCIIASGRNTRTIQTVYFKKKHIQHKFSCLRSCHKLLMAKTAWNDSQCERMKPHFYDGHLYTARENIKKNWNK